MSCCRVVLVITANAPQICAVRDFEIQICLPLQTLTEDTNFQT